MVLCVNDRFELNNSIFRDLKYFVSYSMNRGCTYCVAFMIYM